MFCLAAVLSHSSVLWARFWTWAKSEVSWHSTPHTQQDYTMTIPWLYHDYTCLYCRLCSIFLSFAFSVSVQNIYYSVVHDGHITYSTAVKKGNPVEHCQLSIARSDDSLVTLVDDSMSRTPQLVIVLVQRWSIIPWLPLSLCPRSRCCKCDVMRCVRCKVNVNNWYWWRALIWFDLTWLNLLQQEVLGDIATMLEEGGEQLDKGVVESALTAAVHLLQWDELVVSVVRGWWMWW